MARDGEVWRQVSGWPYSVSDLGRVRNDRTNHILTPSPHSHGYHKVSLCCEGHRRDVYVHHLVLNEFVGPAADEEECNHKNGDKADNRLENLEWVTRGQNAKHAVHTGLYIPARGTRIGVAKLNPEAVKVIRFLSARGKTAAELARAHGVSQRTVKQVINRETWRHVA